MKDVVRYGSVTETAQLSSSNETCVELRSERFDETGNPIDATLLEGLSQMSTRTV